MEYGIWSSPDGTTVFACAVSGDLPDVAETLESFIEQVYYESEAHPKVVVTDECVVVRGGTRYEFHVPVVGELVELAEDLGCDVRFASQVESIDEIVDMKHIKDTEDVDPDIQQGIYRESDE